MRIDKQQIVEFLEARGDKAAAERAEHDLPNPVDTDDNADQIALLGIDQDDLTTGLGGLGGFEEPTSSDTEEE